MELNPDKNNLEHLSSGNDFLEKYMCKYIYWYWHCISCLVYARSCLTLCHPMVCSLLGFSVHGLFQARILEWVSVSFSRGSSWPRDRTWVCYTCCIVRWIRYHLCHHCISYILFYTLLIGTSNDEIITN